MHLPANSIAESQLVDNLIIASPTLQENCFHKAVIYMVEHQPQHGSIGLVLNKPTGKQVGDLLSSNDFSTLAQLPVYYGGPVDSDKLHFASFRFQTNNRVSIHPQLSSDEASQKLIQNTQMVRAFIGHAGWSKGQLSEELSQHTWFTAPATHSVLTAEKDTHLWYTCLQDLSPFHHVISLTPDNPFLN